MAKTLATTPTTAKATPRCAVCRHAAPTASHHGSLACTRAAVAARRRVPAPQAISFLGAASTSTQAALALLAYDRRPAILRAAAGSQRHAVALAAVKRAGALPPAARNSVLLAALDHASGSDAVRVRAACALPARLSVRHADPVVRLVGATRDDATWRQRARLAKAGWHLDEPAVREALAGQIEALCDGPTGFSGLYSSASLHVAEARVVDGWPVLCLHVEGWQAYSRGPARYRRASYVGGIGDSGLWCRRVTGDIESVDQALADLVPAEGRGWRARQGDVLAVPTTQAHDAPSGPVLGTRHLWDAVTRTLTHPEHAPVRVAFPCRFVVQRTRFDARGD